MNYILHSKRTWPNFFKRFKSTSFTELVLRRGDEAIGAHALTDNFGRHHTYLRISLTERCNLRCTYCMPEEGVSLSHQSKLLTTEEILILADIFVQNGIRKIRLTGGEPTVRKDLPDIIRGLKKLRGLTKGVSITTNGLMLTRKLTELQRAGLDDLNISLDTLKPKRYEDITRRKGWEKVMAGIDLALQLGYNPVKINCVLIKDFNDDEVADFVEMTREKNVDVRFIEYMPFDGNKWTGNKLVPYREVLKSIFEKYPDTVKLEDGPNDTSKAYKVPNYRGQIGFITSMSEHFCSSCNRLRLTADGNLKVCLFGNTEISLRDALRSDTGRDVLTTLIVNAVRRKKKQHAGLRKREKQIRGILNFPSFNKSLIDIANMYEGKNFLLRTYSTGIKLTHSDEKGIAKMVDVTEKSVSRRMASAVAVVRVGSEIIKLIRENNLKKGDVIATAKLAAIMAAKRTSELIPLCHNIPLNHIHVETTFDDETVKIITTVKCDGKTGVEMEALLSASILALTIYDMCKAVSHDIVIEHIKLVEKSGGSSGDFLRK